MFIKQHQMIKGLTRLFFLSLLSCLVLACTTNVDSHKTYNYATFTCPENVLLQPGSPFSKLKSQDTQILTIKWQPRPGPDTSNSTPSQVTLQAELIGPFPSLQTFQQIPQPDGTMKYLPNSPVISVAPIIHATNWDHKTYVSNIQFPQRLAPGYYQIVEMFSLSGNNGNAHGVGRCIIMV